MSAPNFSGCCKAGVHQHRAFGVGHFGQRGDIHQLGQRIGRRLDEQQLGVGLDRRIPAREVRQGHVVHFDTEALEILLEQADGRTEHAARHQHVVAGAAQAHHHRQDRRHAGSRGYRLLSTFQRSNTLFERSHSRIGITRIDIARYFTGKTRGGVGSSAEHVAGSEEHRVTVLTFGGAVLASAHCQGIESYAIEVAVQPTGIPFLTHAGTPYSILYLRYKTGPSGPVSTQLLYRSMIALTAWVLIFDESLRACSILFR